MTPADIDTLDWAKGDGLLPAIAQHARSGRVLMLGYVDRAALERSFATGNAVFYSRTRRKLWTKGETSGNNLRIESITTDCDRDTVLLAVEPRGPTCHLGTASCFDATRPFLDGLDALIATRIAERPEGSYTARLAASGVEACARKVGEEALEVVLAAVGESDERLGSEAADLLYHLLVLLNRRGLALDEVLAHLARRHAESG